MIPPTTANSQSALLFTEIRRAATSVVNAQRSAPAFSEALAQRASSQPSQGSGRASAPTDQPAAAPDVPAPDDSAAEAPVVALIDAQDLTVDAQKPGDQSLVVREAAGAQVRIDGSGETSPDERLRNLAPISETNSGTISGVGLPAAELLLLAAPRQAANGSSPADSAIPAEVFAANSTESLPSVLVSSDDAAPAGSAPDGNASTARASDAAFSTVVIAVSDSPEAEKNPSPGASIQPASQSPAGSEIALLDGASGEFTGESPDQSGERSENQDPRSDQNSRSAPRALRDAPDAAAPAPQSTVDSSEIARPSVEARVFTDAQSVRTTGSTGHAAAPTDENIAFTAQVSRGLEAALRQSGGAVTIRLHPESLGSLRIDLRFDGGGVVAQFEAASDTARDLLTKNLATLRAALEAKGFGVRSVDIQVAQPQSGGEASQDFSRSFDNGRSASHDPRSGADGTNTPRREDPGGGFDAQRSVESLTEVEQPGAPWRSVYVHGYLNTIA